MRQQHGRPCLFRRATVRFSKKAPDHPIANLLHNLKGVFEVRNSATLFAHFTPCSCFQKAPKRSPTPISLYNNHRPCTARNLHNCGIRRVAPSDSALAYRSSFNRIIMPRLTFNLALIVLLLTIGLRVAQASRMSETISRNCFFACANSEFQAWR